MRNRAPTRRSSLMSERSRVRDLDEPSLARDKEFALGSASEMASCTRDLPANLSR